jgi:hypothetical protein
MKRLAQHTQRGGQIRGDRNWEKGMPLSAVIDSAIRHLYDFLEGKRNEDHLAAGAWNIMVAMHVIEMIQRGNLPADLDDLPNYLSSDTSPKLLNYEKEATNDRGDDETVNITFPPGGYGPSYVLVKKTDDIDWEIYPSEVVDGEVKGPDYFGQFIDGIWTPHDDADNDEIDRYNKDVEKYNDALDKEEVTSIVGIDDPVTPDTKETTGATVTICDENGVDIPPDKVNHGQWGTGILGITDNAAGEKDIIYNGPAGIPTASQKEADSGVVGNDAKQDIENDKARANADDEQWHYSLEPNCDNCAVCLPDSTMACWGDVQHRITDLNTGGEETEYQTELEKTVEEIEEEDIANALQGRPMELKADDVEDKRDMHQLFLNKDITRTCENCSWSKHDGSPRPFSNICRECARLSNWKSQFAL